MINRKAIVIDLDGTLLNSNKQISKYDLEAVNKCRISGHIIIIATARPLRTALLSLPVEFHDLYFVLCNGSWIVKNDVILYRNEIESELVLKITNDLLKYGFGPAIEAVNQFYTDKKSITGFIGNFSTLNQYPKTPACKILSFIPQGIAEKEIHEIMSMHKLSYILTDNNTLLQIAGKNCSKAAACEKIFGMENISKEMTYAFGDDNNDISVFNIVGCGIAMENSSSGLKAISKYSTSSNDNDGVGKGIYKYILSDIIPI